jgi:DNA processing protein
MTRIGTGSLETKMFGGLDETEILTRLTALAPGSEGSSVENPSVAAAAEVFARAAFSGIAEPGDRVAGILIATLGASGALDGLVQRLDAKRIVGLICETEAGVALGLSADDEFVQLVGAGLDRWAPRLNAREALAHLERAARFAITLLTPAHTAWPEGLNDLGLHAPHALWVRGSLDVLTTLPLSIALVGARASTGYGEHVTMEAAAGLVDRGVSIVSGAAYGIDGMAHRSALASGGNTVAFLAGGVDRFYPSGHDALLHRIVASGAVVSELPCGSSPTKWRFLQRNRLIAAASAATVVVEAGWRSGSLNTAGHASSLGRPLGVVPGPITSASSAGCHRLLRETDAILVTSAAEMAELISLNLHSSGALMDATTAVETEPRASSEERRILDALSLRTPRSAEDIARRAGISVPQTQSILGLCLLAGRTIGGEKGWRRLDSEQNKMT